MQRFENSVTSKINQHLNASSYWIFLVISILISICGVYVTRNYLMDDALITLRYSYNFANLGVPIWNQADINNPSMGYTSILWMTINSLPALFTSNKDTLVLTAKLFAFIPLMGIVVLISSEIFSLRIQTYMKFLAIFVVFSQLGYGLHVNSAMETMLFSFVVLSVVLAYSKEHYRLAYVFGTLSFLVRPEGALLVALLCLWDLKNRRLRQAFTGGVVFLILVGCTAGLLYYWYGDVFPNPFYAKQEVLNIDALKRTAFFIATVALPFLIMATYAVFSQRNKMSYFMFVSAVVYIIYYSTVDPIMNVMSRYQWPTLVLLTFASIPMLELTSTGGKRHKPMAGFLLLVLTVIIFGNALGASYFANAEGHAMTNIIIIGKKMAEFRDPEKWLVYHDAGGVCYFSDWNTHETIGLTNRLIATGKTRQADIYQNPNSQIVMRNFDLLAEGQERSKREFSSKLSQYGFHHIQDIPILSVTGQRNFVIAVYARDINFANMVFQETRVTGPMQPGLSYKLYSFVKSIVRGG